VLQTNRNSPHHHSTDFSYWVLVVTVVIALVFVVLLSRDNLKQRRAQIQLKSTLATSIGTISGPPEALKGDIVPSFEGVSIRGKPVKVFFDGQSKYLLFIFSVQCDACIGQMSRWNSIVRDIKNEKYSVLGMMQGSSSLTVPPLDFDVVAIPNMSVQRAYRVVAIPEIMIVSEGGKVQWVHYGELNDAITTDLLSTLNPNRRQ